jgi:hypothetical protein
MEKMIEVQVTRIASIIERLAACYPDGYYGVLRTMNDGPARDYLSSWLESREEKSA